MPRILATARRAASLRALALLATVAAPVACGDDTPATAPLDATPAVGAARGPNGLPENGRIFFASRITGDAEIYSMEPDGSDLRRLTFNPGPDADPAVSPDGRKVVFARSGELFTMNEDGSGVRQLTTIAAQVGPGADAYGAAWSPDGRQVAFTAELNGVAELYVVGASGSGFRKLSDGAGLRETGASWSPDGARIAFASNRAGNTNVWIMNADGSNPVQFTNCDDCHSPAWSPDGTRIAYRGQGHALHAQPVSASGTPAGLPMQLSDVAFGPPAWSPDGVRLVFAALLTGTQSDLMTIFADGSQPTTITSTAVDDTDPSWSPR